MSSCRARTRDVFKAVWDLRLDFSHFTWIQGYLKALLYPLHFIDQDPNLCELSFTLKLELVDRMASISETAVAAERDANIVVPQVFVEGNYLGVSE